MRGFKSRPADYPSVAQWSTQRTFNPWTAGSSPARGTRAPLAQWTERPPSKRLTGVRFLRGARPHRLTAKIAGSQPADQGSSPCGATAGSSTGRAERAHNPRQVGSTPTPATKAGCAPGPKRTAKRSNSISCRPTAGRRTVNPAMEVRVLPREHNSWGRSSAGQSTGSSTRASRVRVPSVPPGPLRSLSPTDRQAAYEAADAGSTPAGDAHARLAQLGERPVHTGQAGGSSPSSRTEDEAEGSKHRAVTPVQAGFESRHPPQLASVAERSIAPGCNPGSSDTVVRIHPGARFRRFPLCPA
jgi:hypothetical protein